MISIVPAFTIVRRTIALAMIGLLVAGFTSLAHAASVTLAWNPSPSTGIAGYRLYYGTSSGNYPQVIDVGNTTVATVSNLATGQTYYFVVTDYNTAGLESAPSNQVAFTTGPNPAPDQAIGQNTIAPGDFNGDGKDDILWRNNVTGDTWIWLMNGNSVADAARVAIVDLSWTIVGVGDFDGQGRRDILWYNTSLGRVAIWTMNGFTETGSYEFQAPAGAPGEWAVVGIADFDQTGFSDILWRDTQTGALYMWKSVSPFAFVSIGMGTADPSWKVAGTADVEGSGMPDIIWHNSVTGPDKTFVSPLIGMDQGILRVVHDDQSNIDRVYRWWGQPVNESQGFKERIPVTSASKQTLQPGNSVKEFLGRAQQMQNQ